MICKQLSKNKALELAFFEDGWNCILDLTIGWTTKASGQDHWGFVFCFVLFGIKVIELNNYDINHNDPEEDT